MKIHEIITSIVVLTPNKLQQRVQRLRREGMKQLKLAARSLEKP